MAKLLLLYSVESRKGVAIPPGLIQRDETCINIKLGEFCNEADEDQTKRIKQKASRLLCFLLGICLLIGLCSGTAYAKERRTVKVAFFPMEGYHEKNTDGSKAGMDVEYLDSLRKYADWNLEFVECDSWDAALALLSQRKVDLVGSAQYSAERASPTNTRTFPAATPSASSRRTGTAVWPTRILKP